MTTTALSLPIFRAFASDGTPLAGGLLYTYAAGTTTPKATYSDPAGIVPNSNPVVLDSTGTAVVRLGTGAYKFVLRDSADSLSPSGWTVDQYTASYLTQSDIGSALYPKNSDEIAAGVTPTNYGYPPGHVLRYGAVLDGSTDDTAALTRWASVGSALTFPVNSVARISAAISLVSNTTISMSEGATIMQYATSVSILSANSKTNITIRGGKLVQHSAGSGSEKIGGIELTSCTDCIVDGVEIVGCEWGGVLLNGSNRCTVQNCYIHDALGSRQDAADIALYNTCIRNCIVNNDLYGIGNEHGVLIEDPYAGEISTRNLVSGNRIGEHTAFGIIVYLPGSSGAGNSCNQIIGNYVEDIQGSFASNRDSGAGIYTAGSWTGGTIISANVISNCCVQTLTRSLTPAGIGINSNADGCLPIIVSGNIVTGMTRGDGINVSSSPGGAIVSGNSITIPTDNDGTGSGVALGVGSGIRIDSSSNVVLSDNNVIAANAGPGLQLFATGANHNNITVSGGVYRSTSGAPIYVVGDGSHYLTGLTINGVSAYTSNNTASGMTISAAIDVLINGVKVSCGTQSALYLSASLRVTVGTSNFQSTGTYSVTTNGTCTGTVFSKSNYWNQRINNSGTGAIIETLSTAVPSVGTWAVGDTWWQSVPVSGQAPGGMCTVAGTPGTWKNMAVLA